jgi:hypothetical protein
MENWEKAKAFSSIFAAIGLPLVLLVIGQLFSSAVKEREVEGRFVELAVEVLREQPDEQTRGLRAWGIKVLDQYSGIPFSTDTAEALIERVPLPNSTSVYDRRLGNIVEGDREKFIGRGYLLIRGRSNYTQFSKLTGFDLLANPEMAQDPKVAAAMFAAWFKQNESRIEKALASAESDEANPFGNRLTGNDERISSLFEMYRSAPRDDQGRLLLGDTVEEEWRTRHVPLLLSALDEQNIDDPDLRAYALALADLESFRAKFMLREPTAWTESWERLRRERDGDDP